MFFVEKLEPEPTQIYGSGSARLSNIVRNVPNF